MQGVEVRASVANTGTQMLRRSDVRQVLYRMRAMIGANIHEANLRGDELRAAHERRRLGLLNETFQAIERECPVFRNVAPIEQIFGAAAPHAENNDGTATD